MSQTYPGGYITRNPPAPTASAAPGVWTLDQATQNIQAGTWPSATTYIEDVFSTFLYTGNGSTQTITNGIDLSTQGGLVWLKGRSGATDHALYDTARGATKDLVSNSTAAETTQSTGLTAFNTTGFNIGALAKLNTSAATYASWTFRKQPKFFDVVTYTGNGASSQVISHALGSVPGCVIIKRTDSTSDWYVYHRGYEFAPSEGLALNLTSSGTSTYRALLSVPTDTTFTAYIANTNTNGATYVAYLFAHNAGGFGLTGSDNVISCGSYTTDSSGNATINLGYEPQFLLVKRSDSTSNWVLMDVMRGQSQTNTNPLYADLSSAEASYSVGYFPPTATGFKCNAGLGTGVQTHIYIAIRRGPMKVPTSGTSVYVPSTRTGTGATGSSTALGAPTDLVFTKQRGSTQTWAWTDRLRGATNELTSASTAAEAAYANDVTGFDSMTGFSFGSGASGQVNTSASTYIDNLFRRAPGFFDVVCYTGDSTVGRQVAHGLGVAPELMIVKVRNAAGPENWEVYNATSGNTKTLRLQTSNLEATSSIWNNTSPTSTYFVVGATGNFGSVNFLTYNYVAYLFATVAGVSKVFSYTGNGSSQTINCGFTAGARFILIKRTDSTGDWYVWDTARGIVSANDPHLSLNTTAAEVTTDDSIDPDSSGFIVNQVAATDINVTSATYIGLAIA